MALDADQQEAEARKQFNLPADAEPTEEQLDKASAAMLTRAAEHRAREETRTSAGPSRCKAAGRADNRRDQQR